MPEADGGRVREIAPGTFAISDLVDLREPVSWAAPGTAAFDPSTCYLVLARADALLIDTGLRAHGAAIGDRLAALLPAGTRLWLTMTRVEPDALGNVDVLAERFRFAGISSQTNVIPLDYIGPLSGRYPDVAITNGLLPGDRVPFGERELLVVEPAVRTLPTLWYYDQVTRTLFTSDFFGGAFVEESDAWTPSPAPDIAATRAHLLAKFDWLAIADTSSAVARLRGVRDGFEIDVIAPGHGLWTVGRKAVEHRIEVTLAALESLGTRARSLPVVEVTS